MKAYLDLLEHVLVSGKPREDRTGVGTLSVFGYQMRVHLGAGFPLLTTKRMHWKSIVEELLWILLGKTNTKPLQSVGVSIWDEWATAEQCAKFGREAGDLGPIYGHQWRNFGASRRDGGGYRWDGVDQIGKLVAGLRSDPMSRRHVVTAWNPREVDEVTLPPCHTMMQFYVDRTSKGDALSCHMYQRSGDAFLGVPFNIASYALLTHLIALRAGMSAGDLVISYGDLHLYKNHKKAAIKQLERLPRRLPRLEISIVMSSLTPQAEHIWLSDYSPWPAIKAKVAV